MTYKETNIRTILFLVVGILLLITLIVCVFIVKGEEDLVKTDAVINSVKNDSGGTGKNDVLSEYEVDGNIYNYNFYTKDDLNEGDSIQIYYHEKNPTIVTVYKVPKAIFIFPLIGLVLCGLGLYELFKKDTSTSEDDFKTSVIGVVGNTAQLKIIPNDDVPQYQKTPEEEKEISVKAVKKPEDIFQTSLAAGDEVKEEVVPKKKEFKIPIILEKKFKKKEKEVKEEVQPVQQPVVQPVQPEVPKVKPIEVPKALVEEVQKEEVAPVVTPVQTPKVAPVVAPKVLPNQEEPKEQVPEIPKVAPVKEEVKAPKVEKNEMTDALVKKVQNNMVDTKSAINEDDIKKAIKDVLKEVLEEVKDEEVPKVVKQVRVLPNYYYISGTSLIYEEAGKEAKEISLKTVKSVVKTINSEGNVVKLIVSNDEVKCILTNMKNIDLEQVASLLTNKMHTIDENFKEVIEYKEY